MAKIPDAVMPFVKWSGAAGLAIFGSACPPTILIGLLGLWLAGEAADGKANARIESLLRAIKDGQREFRKYVPVENGY